MCNGANQKRGAHQGLPSCLTHIYNPPQRPLSQDKGMVTVYYDGACPTCVKDRYNYEKLSGDEGKKVRWFDITGQEERLREIGIDPQKALMELHVKNENQQILSEIDAYILLMSKVPLLRPLAWLIGLPLIRPMISKVYHRQVHRRLRRSGRL
jgi:predicted DCC family thiol-disulfide oxidoreductase YuxK